MKIRGSKFYYYVWLILIIVGNITGTLIFFSLFQSQRTDATLATSIFNACFFAYTFFAIRKYVYVEEKENNTLLIGNIFFSSTILSKPEKYINFWPNMYKINFEGKIYWFMSLDLYC
jgi:hypothetical protein